MQTLMLAGFQVFAFKPTVVRHPHCILFSHATGICAATYASLLQQWSDLWGVDIYSYDCRGFGQTQLSLRAAYADGRNAVGQTLVKDLETVFWAIKNHQKSSQDGAFDTVSKKVLAPLERPWLLAGHSFGGWLALQAAARCHVSKLLLWDIAILPPMQASLWAAACFFGQRGLNPLASAARRRKRRFASRAEALKTFQRTPFFRRWPKPLVETYVDAHYETKSAGLLLKHEPRWEADLFECQPPSATLAILALPPHVRAVMKAHLIVGAASATCHASFEPTYRKLLPQGSWTVLPGAGHMFPFESEGPLLGLLKEQSSHYLGHLATCDTPEFIKEAV